MAPSPPPALLPPPEGIFRTFEDLLTSVQRIAKDQGYGVVKLRASNYRDGKPTRYDLVCDRGGVKYNSTAKKRNPSTRKVDCPWRAKAVCEVQLGNQWRFAVQEGRHNHEPRVPAAPAGADNTPVTQSIRTFINKLDRINHDMSQGFMRIEQRLDDIQKRMDKMDGRITTQELGFQMPPMEPQGRIDGLAMDQDPQLALSGAVIWENDRHRHQAVLPSGNLPLSSPQEHNNIDNTGTSDAGADGCRGHFPMALAIGDHDHLSGHLSAKTADMGEF